jgi:hypothetical protein
MRDLAHDPAAVERNVTLNMQLRVDEQTRASDEIGVQLAIFQRRLFGRKQHAFFAFGIVTLLIVHAQIREDHPVDSVLLVIAVVALPAQLAPLRSLAKQNAAPKQPDVQQRLFFDLPSIPDLAPEHGQHPLHQRGSARTRGKIPQLRKKPPTTNRHATVETKNKDKNAQLHIIYRPGTACHLQDASEEGDWQRVESASLSQSGLLSRRPRVSQQIGPHGGARARRAAQQPLRRAVKVLHQRGRERGPHNCAALASQEAILAKLCRTVQTIRTRFVSVRGIKAVKNTHFSSIQR